MALEDFDWRGFITKVAPTVGTALGGPLAGVAISSISQILLGKPDGSASEIAAEISSGALDGDQIVRMRELEAEFQQREQQMGVTMAELEFKRDELAISDIKDARARQVSLGDYMPQTIFFIFLLVYAVEVAMFFFGKMPEDEFVRALMTRAFGTVEGGLVGAVAYFIGSSRGSKQSGDAVRKIAEQASR